MSTLMRINGRQIADRKLKNRIETGCFAGFLFFCLLSFRTTSAQYYQGERAYHDTTYYSEVFGHRKTYRIYLPRGYAGSGRRYPVIYYFHGWGGRYNSDENAKLDYDKIKGIVDKYRLILVMVDGNITPSEPRPYNVGYHDDVKFQVQMKDYFPELVHHIDATYRTIANRDHRGIIGFSMGGFISFYLAGKYPDKVCAAVSLAGSPEFYVGYPDNHTLYSMRYAFMNLRQVSVALRNGSSDILYYLNREVLAGARWDEQVHFQYWTFPGPHMIDPPGKTTAYEKAVSFINDAFKKRTQAGDAAPQHWSHEDLYRNFSVWHYRVQSDKDAPGFLYLRNVDQKGFGFYTKRWLPDGPPEQNIQARIKTAPIYKSGETYELIRYDKLTGKVTQQQVKSDDSGRITVGVRGSGNEIGIATPEADPEYVFLDDTISSEGGRRTRFLHVGGDNALHVRLFNRGGEKVRSGVIRISISTRDTSVHWTRAVVTVNAAGRSRILQVPAFNLISYKRPPPHAEPAAIRFHLSIQAPWGNSKGEFTVPVFFDVPPFDSIKVDDGVAVRDTALGEGNADGAVNSGERVMLYQGSHRLRLYTEDPFVVSGKERLSSEIIPERWPDGYTLSSVVQIAPDCPDGHQITFLANYETKTYNPIERSVHWGKVTLTVHHAAKAR